MPLWENHEILLVILISLYHATKAQDSSQGDVIPISMDDQAVIVHLHNHLRAHVIPPASDMQVMEWNADAANPAENLARDCERRDHDDRGDRTPTGWHYCGLNLLIISWDWSWNQVMRDAWWGSVIGTFQYGETGGGGGLVGPYTQIVWNVTSSVGCARACATTRPWREVDRIATCVTTVRAVTSTEILVSLTPKDFQHPTATTTFRLSMRIYVIYIVLIRCTAWIVSRRVCGTPRAPCIHTEEVNVGKTYCPRSCKYCE